MVFEVYYLDYNSVINQTNELDYVNLNQIDKTRAKTTMNKGILYNQDGTVGGSSEIISFIRNDIDESTVISMFSIFTNNGLLNFNLVKKYNSSYDPTKDIILSYSNFASGIYFSENPVLMKMEPVGDYPKIVLKISLITSNLHIL